MEWCDRRLCHVTGNTRIRGWSALDERAILLCGCSLSSWLSLNDWLIDWSKRSFCYLLNVKKLSRFTTSLLANRHCFACYQALASTYRPAWTSSVSEEHCCHSLPWCRETSATVSCSPCSGCSTYRSFRSVVFSVPPPATISGDRHYVNWLSVRPSVRCLSVRPLTSIRDAMRPYLVTNANAVDLSKFQERITMCLRDSASLTSELKHFVQQVFSISTINRRQLLFYCLLGVAHRQHFFHSFFFRNFNHFYILVKPLFAFLNLVIRLFRLWQATWSTEKKNVLCTYKFNSVNYLKKL